MENTLNNTCPICYDDIIDNIFTCYECNNIFHNKCIISNMQINNDKKYVACPLCRVSYKNLFYNNISTEIINIHFENNIDTTIQNEISNNNDTRNRYKIIGKKILALLLFLYFILYIYLICIIDDIIHYSNNSTNAKIINTNEIFQFVIIIIYLSFKNIVNFLNLCFDVILKIVCNTINIILTFIFDFYSFLYIKYLIQYNSSFTIGYYTLLGIDLFIIFLLFFLHLY